VRGRDLEPTPGRAIGPRAAEKQGGGSRPNDWKKDGGFVSTRGKTGEKGDKSAEGNKKGRLKKDDDFCKVQIRGWAGRLHGTEKKHAKRVLGKRRGWFSNSPYGKRKSQKKSSFIGTKHWDGGRGRESWALAGGKG